jgi:diguanylate cyclase (GGDEF)-like protein/PAS domain S-box-containing protein
MADDTSGQPPSSPAGGNPMPHLSALVDLGDLNRLLDSFCATVGIAAAIIDLSGKVLAASRWQRICTDFHRIGQASLGRCIESDTELASQLQSGQPFSVYRCRNGLTDAASPVIIEDQHLANVFVGQFLLEEPDVGYFAAQAKSNDFDRDAYLTALSDVPVIDETRLPGILAFLSEFAHLIASIGLQRLRAERAGAELARHRSQLEQTIAARTHEIAAARDAMEENREKYRALSEAAFEAIFISEKGRCLEQNQRAEHMFGYSAEEATGRMGTDWIHPDDRDRVMANIMAGHEQPYEVTALRKDGSTFPAIIRGKMMNYNGRSVRVTSMSDITERKQAEQALLESEAYNKVLFAGSRIAMGVIDPQTLRFLDCNQAMVDIHHLPDRHTVLALKSLDVSPHEQYDGRSTAEHAAYRIRRALNNGSDVFEWLHQRPDGSLWDAEVHLMTFQHAGRTLLQFSVQDITERRRAEAEIRDLAFYDPLTHLPNRRLLLDRLQHALATCARAGRSGALMFFDLDDFKTLNDARGHVVGDQLLVETARRLQAAVRESDTVARLGGDEFVIMLEGLPAGEAAALQAEAIATQILAVTRQPCEFHPPDDTDHQHNIDYHSSASIGIVLFGESSSSADIVMQHADLAMYEAKAAGRNTLRFFDPAMHTSVAARAVLNAELRRSIPEGQLRLHYQPQVDWQGRLTGAEALVRWQHPVRGLVPPGQFIPQAEESGQIVAIGQWVLETACAQLAAWAGGGECVCPAISVNVSARQFRQADFVSSTLAIIANSGADPHRLKLELTESLLLEDTEEVIARMLALKKCGVGFSLDDFGTGYSSLSYLKRLPLDQLKIDQSFVRDVQSDASDAAIARTIIALGQGLGLSVIAEGVETSAQRDALARSGCHAYQGYLFSRPLPIDEFMAFAQRHAY